MFPSGYPHQQDPLLRAHKHLFLFSQLHLCCGPHPNRNMPTTGLNVVNAQKRGGGGGKERDKENYSHRKSNENISFLHMHAYIHTLYI